jgi:glutamate synthase (NADPH/NADH) small chain
MVFRISSSQEEGGERLFAKRTVRLEGDERGQLCALHWNDERVEVDLVIQAMGFAGPETAGLSAQLGVELDARGNVKGDTRFQTSVPGVFVGGDAYRGASLIVWAISDGRELARHVDAFLMGRHSRLPSKGRDLPFGGR